MGVANNNPLRYRRYYYDTETGFYYLQSRYYDPIVKRFLNADSYGSTGQGFLGYNMFAYCGNNPVSRTDPSGHSWIEDIFTYIEMIKEKMSEIINGQGRDLFRNISFGNSTVGDSGCGAIAVHNAFLLLGKASNFLNTLAWFEEKSSFRTFGVFPWEIDDYLDAQGIQYESSCSASLMNNVEAGGVIIVTFWNEVKPVGLISYPCATPVQATIPNVFSGAHTVAITYDPSDQKYCIYNAFNTRDTVYKISNINDYIAGGYIYGYYIRG